MWRGVFCRKSSDENTSQLFHPMDFWDATWLVDNGGTGRIFMSLRGMVGKSISFLRIFLHHYLPMS